MKALLCCTGILASAIGFAQSGPALQCVASASVPPTLRAEGLTELVGDLALSCTGGTPTPLGQQIPQITITVTLNTAITGRLFQDGSSESLLIIDEPGTGLATPTWTPLGCPPPGPCNTLGNGTGIGQYTGTAGHPNVFQGRTVGVSNSVVFQGVPISPPGTTARILRFTNIRANANALSPNGAPSQVTALISISPSSALTITNSPVVIAGYIHSGLAVGIKGSSHQYCNGLDGNSTAPGPGATSLTIKEGFPQSFRQQKSVPAAVGPNTGTESGTLLPATAGLSPLVGAADTGTNIGATFIGLLPGLTLTTPVLVSIMDSTTGTLAGTATIASPTGTVIGNNLVATGDASGSASFTLRVDSRDPANNNIVFMAPAFTLGGAPTALQTPANIFVVPKFVNSPQEPALFAVAHQDSTLLYPFLTSLNGFNTPLGTSNTTTDPFLEAISIVGCVNAGNSLNPVSGQPLPAFAEVLAPPAAPGATPGTNAIVPRAFNVPIVSGGLPTTGVTVTVSPPAPWLNVGMSDTTTPFTAFLSANTAAAGNYSTTLTFNAPGGISTSVPVTYSVTAGPWFNIYGFGNSASYVNTVVAPGEPFVIFGGNAFGPTTIAGPTLGANGLVPTTVGTTQVLFDGTPAPLYYSLNNNGIGQVAGFAPFGLTGKTTTNVQVVYNNVASPVVQLAVVDAVPGLYTADSSGGGQGAILNHDLSVNSSSNAESIGNPVVFYGGGAGQTSPPGRDGALAGVGGPLATLILPVEVFIDGIAAIVQYAGPAPGLVEGVFQINAVIPAGVHASTNVPVIVVVDGTKSQQGVTLAVK
jgi:uncharacterized protein (TIGR03437 family)